MTDHRWMIVGQDPAPTADDLPIFWQPRGTAYPLTNFTEVPDLMDGDHWCRVTLPPEPEPEDDGVEVDDRRYRVDPSNPRYVQVRGSGASWAFYAMTDRLQFEGRVAVALGLVPPPVDERVQAVIDAAKAWRGNVGPTHYLSPSSRELVRRLDALDAAPTPAADDEPEPSWPPMRPMSELPDGHDFPVLIAYQGGRRMVERGTRRAYETTSGRLGWWPLPPHPKGADQ